MRCLAHAKTVDDGRSVGEITVEESILSVNASCQKKPELLPTHTVKNISSDKIKYRTHKHAFGHLYFLYIDTGPTQGAMLQSDCWPTLDRPFSTEPLVTSRSDH